MLSQTNKQTKVRAVEIVADYKPDNERMMQALMLVLDLDDSVPAGEHEDAICLSDSVS